MPPSGPGGTGTWRISRRDLRKSSAFPGRASRANDEKDRIVNCEKYLLYNDPFQGLFDSTLAGGEGEGFAQCARALENAPETGEWAYLFRTQKALCRVLEYKAELGQRTRVAYQAGDRAALAALVEDRLGELYEAFREQWDRENKSCGFEVQDIRLGGLRQRLRHCRESLERYLAGELEAIEELAAPQLDVSGKGADFAKRRMLFNSWRETVTANVL